MAKIISTLILVVVVIAVQGQAPEYEEVIKAAKAGNWDQVQELLNSNLGKQAGWKPPSFNSLRELKPENGGHVYGEAEYAYHSASNVNGRTTEQNAGHKIINEDGRVKEYDFTPSTSYTPHLPSIISPVGQKAGDYVASDYHYQYGGSVSGKPNFASQKLNNNLPQDYYPRNSAVVPIPPKKQPNSPDVEYEYVLTSSTEDDKQPREIKVSEENKFNVLNGAEQNNEIAQTNDQTPVSYKKPGEDKNYNNGLKYNIDFDEPPEAEQVTTNDNKRPKPFEITMMTTEPQLLLRVANVGRKSKTTPTTVPADDYLYNIPPVFLEDEKPSSNSNQENKINKKINKDTQIVITFGDETTDKPAPVIPRTSDVPTPSRIPIENLFSNIDYMAGPAVTDRSFIKFKYNNQAKNKKTTIARKRSKMSDADYMAYVASAIEDGLDKMTQHIKNRDFEKLYSDMISSPTKAARKERSVNGLFTYLSNQIKSNHFYLLT